MKVKEFLLAPSHITESEVAANTTVGVDAPDPKPITSIKRGKAFGYEYVEVDEDTYHTFTKGKVPFERWTNYVEDEETRNAIKAMYKKNKRLLVKNGSTGRMSFIK